MKLERKVGYFQGCLSAFCIFIAVLVALAALFMFGIRECLQMADASAKKMMSTRDRPADEQGDEYTEVWSAGSNDKKAVKVVRIALTGEIRREAVATLFNPVADQSAAAVRNKIRAAKSDKSVKAILIEINSPGGEVPISDILWHELELFKASAPGRQVFAYLGDVACSGGYYIAAAANYIYALPTTITGSIGVIISSVNVSELAQKLGVKSESIASSANKDLLNPLKPVHPEHIAIFKKAVDSIYDRFVDIVAKGRKLPKNKVKEIADGRILTPEAALACKLIDAIGYEEDVLASISKKMGGKVKFVRYETPFSFGKLFSNDLMPRAVNEIKRAVLLDSAATPTLHYR
jgi:protease-4